jgi:hypothetical protein
LRPKTSRLLFGQLVWRKVIFFHFFLLDEWITYFTSFLEISGMSNSNSIWAHGKFLLKLDFKFIFPVFYEELRHATMWLKLLPRLKGRVLKKKLDTPIESWYFKFFFFFAHGSTWYHLQCDHYNLMWSFWFFSRNFTRSIALKFWVKTSSIKRILAHS